MAVPGALRVAALGPIRAWSGDTELRLGPTLQRAVFGVLALRHDQVVAMADLINAVWGDQAPRTARGSVFSYVSGLRKVLDLDSVGPGYRLRLPGGALDVDEFTAVAESVTGAANQDAPSVLAAADKALALWRGEPLAGLPGPFLAARRERLTAARLDLLTTRAAAALRLGGHTELVAELTALVAEHPLHEGLRAQLMVALYRAGRQADALDQFRGAVRLFAEELAARPGASLAKVHQQILANDPALSPPRAQPVRARPRSRATVFVGREDELSRLRDIADGLATGTGGVAWLDGEPGIGKSELLTAGLAALDEHDVEVCWGAGDVLAQRLPLGVLQECLGLFPESDDPRRARIGLLLRRASTRDGVLVGGTTSLTMVDEVVRLVEQVCVQRPLALVVDDVQWADESSMLVWNRLARMTDRLPLAVVAACRPLPRTEGLDSMRETVATRGGVLLRVDRLADDDVHQVLQAMVHATPGPQLRQLAQRASGNPLYVQELVDALVRDRMVQVTSGTADLTARADATAPKSLTAAVGHRLEFLRPSTVDLLRRAALLGRQFRVDELAAVAEAPDSLTEAVAEATTAGVLVTAGDRLSFRHPVIHTALYEGMGSAMRSALHRFAAQRLHEFGAPLDTVARHLAAGPATVDDWTVRLVAEHGERIAARAPDLGLDLLHRAVASADPAHPEVVGLTASLVRVRYWLGESPEQQVRSVLATTTDPDLAGEMSWILGCVYYRRGMDRRGVEALRYAVESEISDVWRARCRALLAVRERMGLGDVEAAERDAKTAIADGERFGDVFAQGYALTNLWLFRSVERDHVAALTNADDALAALDGVPGADPTLVHLRLSLLDNRVFSLHNLDRIAEAGQTLAVAEDVVRAHQLTGGLTVSSAVHAYWTGEWDTALAVASGEVDAHGLDMAFRGLRESGPMLLLSHGVAALIAVWRDDQDSATRHLEAAARLPLLTSADRENCDFLVIAEALAVERDGRPRDALAALGPILDERYSPMMLRHQWLPDAVRIAVEAGEEATAALALRTCEAEEQKERVPARAHAAAAHCRALVRADPDLAVEVAEHYRDVGRPVEMAKAYEDAAVLFAMAGQAEPARVAHERAVRQYTAFGADWAIRRASTRIRSVR